MLYFAYRIDMRNTFEYGYGRVRHCESRAGETGSCSPDEANFNLRCAMSASRCHIIIDTGYLLFYVAKRHHK